MQKTLFIVAFLFYLLFSPVSSEAAAKVIKNVRVIVNGEKQYFVLFQSPVEPSLWYCGQSKPAVLTRKSGSLEIPEISLIRYQKKDIKNPQNLIEGAHFRMHLSLGPSDEALELLRSKIPKAPDGRQPVLSPVPFGALRLFFQKPDGKELEMKAEPLSGISTSHSSQNVAFSTNLGVLDTDLLDSLMRGNTGAKYELYYNYQYVDPMLSPDDVSNRGDQHDFNRADTASSPAGRDLPGARDFDKIDRDAREKAGWEQAGSGFIGFGRYPRSVQDMCIFIEKDADQWQNAYLSLPVIYKLGEVEIEKIELDVSLVHSKKVYATQKLTWTPEKSWRDVYKAPLVYGVFDLTKIRQQYPGDIKSAYFVVKKRIESNGGDVLTGETTCDVIVGDSSISDPLALAEVLEFQLGFLSWSADPKKGLQRFEVELSEGDWKSVRVIKPAIDGDRLVFPRVAQWLVRHGKVDDTSLLVAQAFFAVANGETEKKIPWSMNGKNLRKELFSLSAILFDQEWSGK